MIEDVDNQLRDPETKYEKEAYEKMHDAGYTAKEAIAGAFYWMTRGNYEKAEQILDRSLPEEAKEDFLKQLRETEPRSHREKLDEIIAW